MALQKQYIAVCCFADICIDQMCARKNKCKMQKIIDNYQLVVIIYLGDWIRACKYVIITNGGLAQLGEHLPCKQGVASSNLAISISHSD